MTLSCGEGQLGSEGVLGGQGSAAGDGEQTPGTRDGSVAGTGGKSPDGQGAMTSTGPGTTAESGATASADGDGKGSDGDDPSTSLPLHRMTAAEYNNTVADLLGTELRPADFFPAAGASEFDANVGVLASLSQVSVQGYYDAARDLARDTFASKDRYQNILTCDPAGDNEAACVNGFIEDFGLRAFRRPLETAEVERYRGIYDEAKTALGLSPVAAVEHVVRVLLASPSFFLRVESESAAPERTEPFALASRLSYFLWSSMPDAELFNAAQDGSLSTAEAVVRETRRMLADPKSQGFYRDFFGQWLGTRSLSSHNADSNLFTDWTPELRDALGEQANEFFESFVDGTYRWDEILTAPHPGAPRVDPLLAQDPSGTRRGFLTLPAFLVQSSHADRTSPTARATAVVGGLLCTTITPPANVDIPDLSTIQSATIAEDNIRERLELHRASPDCASCHVVLDPIGLSLEHFDPIGRYRAAYPSGDAIDTSGEYAGQSFSDLAGLIPIVQTDARLASCPPRKMFAYAMRRSPTADDLRSIQAIAETWDAGSIAALVELVTTQDAFLGAPLAQRNEP